MCIGVGSSSAHWSYFPGGREPSLFPIGPAGEDFSRGRSNLESMDVVRKGRDSLLTLPGGVPHKPFLC